MDIVDKLTEVFKEFPGIGERQARRFVYFLMTRSGGYNDNLSLLISELKKDIKQCSDCYKFFVGSDMRVCQICAKSDIDQSLLMIVEKDSDLDSVNKSGNYKGKYFVLGGLVPIVEKTTLRKVRVEELVKRLNENLDIKEVILAFSMSPQGDHTDLYIRTKIKDTVSREDLKVTSLGRGLSTGTELEYSDNETIKNALEGRH